MITALLIIPALAVFLLAALLVAIIMYRAADANRNALLIPLAIQQLLALPQPRLMLQAELPAANLMMALAILETYLTPATDQPLQPLLLIVLRQQHFLAVAELKAQLRFQEPLTNFTFLTPLDQAILIVQVAVVEMLKFL